MLNHGKRQICFHLLLKYCRIFFEIAHASTKAHLQNGIDVTKRAEGAANSEHTAVGLHENEAQFAQRLRVKTEEKDCISALQSTNLFRCPLI